MNSGVTITGVCSYCHKTTALMVRYLKKAGQRQITCTECSRIDYKRCSFGSKNVETKSRHYHLVASCLGREVRNQERLSPQVIELMSVSGRIYHLNFANKATVIVTFDKNIGAYKVKDVATRLGVHSLLWRQIEETVKYFIGQMNDQLFNFKRSSLASMYVRNGF